MLLFWKGPCGTEDSRSACTYHAVGRFVLTALWNKIPSSRKQKLLQRSSCIILHFPD